MAAEPTYNLTLCSSSGAIQGQLTQPLSVVMDFERNDIHSVVVTLADDDEFESVIQPGLSRLLVHRAPTTPGDSGTLIFYGFLPAEGYERSYAERTITLTFRDPRYYLEGRRLLGTESYSSADMRTIIWGLINTQNGRTDTWIREGSGTTGVTWGAAYTSRDNVLGAIEGLVDAAVVDWDITPVHYYSTDGTRAMGDLVTKATQGTDKTDTVIFSCGNDLDTNVEDIRVSYENPVTQAQAQGTNSAGVEVSSTSGGSNSYGLWEDATYLDDIATSTDVSNWASTEVAQRSTPIAVVEIIHPLPNAPRPFLNYGIGDRVRVQSRANSNASLLDITARIDAIEITIDEGGAERVQLTVSPWTSGRTRRRWRPARKPLRGMRTQRREQQRQQQRPTGGSGSGTLAGASIERTTNQAIASGTNASVTMLATRWGADMVVGSTGSSSPMTTLIAAESPWFHWKLDEASGAFADASGNGRPSTSQSGVTYRVTSIDTDSSSYAAQLGTSTSNIVRSGLPAGNGRSIAGVVRIDSLASTDWLLRVYASAGNPARWGLTANGSNGLRLIAVDGSGSASYSPAGDAITLGRVMGIVITVSSDRKTIRWWIDGTEQPQLTLASGAAESSSDALSLGRVGFAETVRSTWDSVGFWDGALSPTKARDISSAIGGSLRIRAPRAGRYNVSASVTFAAHATGTRRVSVLVNGTEVSTQEIPTAGGSRATVVNVSDTITLAAGDELTVLARQDSGSALNVTSARLTAQFASS